MGDVINLRRARKRKQREQARKKADENALAHGRTRGDVRHQQHLRHRLDELLDGAKRTRPVPRSVPDPDPEPEG